MSPAPAEPAETPPPSEPDADWRAVAVAAIGGLIVLLCAGYFVWRALRG